MTLTGKNYIAGETSAVGADVFYSLDPRENARGELPFYSATEGEVARAVDAAVAAHDELRGAGSARWAGLLDEIAAQIEALGDELLHTADRETGLGLPRLTGEGERTTGQIRAFAALLRDGSYLRAIIDSGPPSIRQMQFPVGPVAIFAASNFPFAFAVAGGDAASALAAGCPIVVKAHPGHPATSELFAQALTAAVAAQGFPAGTFSMLQGAGIDVGAVAGSAGRHRGGGIHGQSARRTGDI